MSAAVVILVFLIIIIAAIVGSAIALPCTFCKDYGTDDAPWYSFLCFKGDDFDPSKAECDYVDDTEYANLAEISNSSSGTESGTETSTLEEDIQTAILAATPAASPAETSSTTSSPQQTAVYGNCTQSVLDQICEKGIEENKIVSGYTKMVVDNKRDTDTFYSNRSSVNGYYMRCAATYNPADAQYNATPWTGAMVKAVCVPEGKVAPGNPNTYVKLQNKDITDGIIGLNKDGLMPGLDGCIGLCESRADCMAVVYDNNTNECKLSRKTGPGIEVQKEGSDVYRRKNYEFNDGVYTIDHTTRPDGTFISNYGDAIYGRKETIGAGPCADRCAALSGCKGFVYNFKDGYCHGLLNVTKKNFGEPNTIYFNKVE